MNLQFAGAVLDLAVSDLDRAVAFYKVLIGRQPDLRPQVDQCEWRLHRDPEVAFRITADPLSAGHGKLAIGVADLATERIRLAEQWAELPPTTEKPNVIALLRLQDPDGNTVTLWQDLLGSRRT
jgi:catechol 2,3-dioxygenase-like lactoylglutathione lyase family enzyme